LKKQCENLIDETSERLPFATTSLILGFLSCVMFGILSSVPAIILGHVSLSKYKRYPKLQGKRIAVAGVVLGYIGILITVFILLRFISIYYGYER
jgi:hypothetical protein